MAELAAEAKRNDVVLLDRALLDHDRLLFTIPLFRLSDVARTLEFRHHPAHYNTADHY
jgi:hypothetical protein